MKWLISLFILLITSPVFAGQEMWWGVKPAGGGSAPIYQTSNSSVGNSTLCGFQVTVTAGQTIVLILSSDSGAVSFTPNDNNGGALINTYSQAGSQLNDANSAGVHSFYTNIYTATATTSATLIYLNTVSSSSQYFTCGAIVYSGSGVAVDKLAVGTITNTSSFSTAASGTTAQANEVVLGIYNVYQASGSQSITQGSPYTLRTQYGTGGAHQTIAIEDYTVSSIGTYTATATAAMAAYGSGIILTLKAN